LHRIFKERLINGFGFGFGFGFDALAA